MHLLGVQRKNNKRRAAAYIACGLLLILADVLFWAKLAWAASPSYTPYANSVAAQNGLGSGTAGSAVGASDGRVALLLGLNSSVTLDMGEGEEGTNALKVYFGPISLQAQVQVDFLDSNQGVINTRTGQLFLSLSPSNQTFAYDWHGSGKAYRFVRFTAKGVAAFGVDAVQALGFIGSSPTQDTDGDGTPDRSDTRPLTPDAPPSSNDGDDNGGGSSGGGSSGSSGGGSRTSTTTIRTITTSAGSGVTPVVNTPPPAADDKDGDQMEDAWELANGLDPANKNDASSDLDRDGLSNLKEYQLDTNPKKADTDSDGIPDGWEVDNGLNAKKDDALEDPDGDYITNLGEYHYDSNPYSADDITQLAARINRKERMWGWAVFVLLLVLAVLALMRGAKVLAVKRHLSKRAKRGIKSSLPPLRV